MNFSEIISAVKYLQKTCKCLQCNRGFKQEEIHLIATTKEEGLFELRCKKCHSSAIISIMMNHDVEIQHSIQRQHRNISTNDVLDIKNFLSTFDGNFKKIFNNKNEKNIEK